MMEIPNFTRIFFLINLKMKIVKQYLNLIFFETTQSQYIIKIITFVMICLLLAIVIFMRMFRWIVVVCIIMLILLCIQACVLMLKTKNLMIIRNVSNVESSIIVNKIYIEIVRKIYMYINDL